MNLLGKELRFKDDEWAQMAYRADNRNLPIKRRMFFNPFPPDGIKWDNFL